MLTFLLKAVGLSEYKCQHNLRSIKDLPDEAGKSGSLIGMQRTYDSDYFDTEFE
jgi:hypothetical protein